VDAECQQHADDDEQQPPRVVGLSTDQRQHPLDGT
jgi:hypothetical protein